jgi:hypothetical protein
VRDIGSAYKGVVLEMGYPGLHAPILCMFFVVLVSDAVHRATKLLASKIGNSMSQVRSQFFSFNAQLAPALQQWPKSTSPS